MQKKTSNSSQKLQNQLRFKELYAQENHRLMYILANQFTYLKETPEYKDIESIYKKRLLIAQKRLMHNDIEAAREILTPYIILHDKRDFILFMLNNNTVFIKFIRYLQNNNFLDATQLAQEYPVLSTLPLYRQMQKEHIQNQFITAYSENDFSRCYELLDTYTELQETKLANMLQKHYSSVISRAKELAQRGDIESLTKTLESFVAIQTRQEEIKELLKLCYRKKIEAFIEEKNLKDSEKLLYLYIDHFGLDEKVNLLILKYNSYAKVKLAVTLEVDPKCL